MSGIEIFTVVSTMLGGLALFLFGMDTLSASMRKMTGGAFDKLISLTGIGPCQIL